MTDRRGAKEPAGDSSLGAYRSVNDLLAENGGEGGPAVPGRNEINPGTDFYMGVFTSVLFLVPVGAVVSVGVLVSTGAEMFGGEPRPIADNVNLFLWILWIAILLSWWLYRLVRAFRTRRPYVGLGMLSTLLAVFLLFGACTVFVREAEITISGKAAFPGPAQARQGECADGESLRLEEPSGKEMSLTGEETRA